MPIAQIQCCGWSRLKCLVPWNDAREVSVIRAISPISTSSMTPRITPRGRCSMRFSTMKAATTRSVKVSKQPLIEHTDHSRGRGDSCVECSRGDSFAEAVAEVRASSADASESELGRSCRGRRRRRGGYGVLRSVEPAARVLRPETQRRRRDPADIVSSPHPPLTANDVGLERGTHDEPASIEARLDVPTTFKSLTLSALSVPGVAVKTRRVCIWSGSRTTWQ